MSCGGSKRSKSLLLSPGLCPCSLMRMLSHVSELPCLTLHIRLVCPKADRKPAKQNSCPWQYKMSLHRRLLTVTIDLRACPIAFLLFYHGFNGLDGYMSCGDKIDQKVCCFPQAYAMQPDAYAQPRKRASLSDHPHPSGLPNGRQECNKTK